MSYRRTDWRNAPRIRFWVAGIAVAIAAVTATASGASSQSAARLSECNQFAESVNRHQTIMDAFEAEIAAFATNAATAETLAEITAAAAQYVDAVSEATDNLEILLAEMEALTLADAQLVDYRSDYISVVTGFNSALAVVSLAMAEVAAAETPAQLSDSLEAVTNETAAAVPQIETLAVDESELIDRVNSYCQAE